MSVLVLHLNSAREQWWLEHLQSLLPDFDCRLWRDRGDETDIEYAVVWRLPEQGLKQLTRLRCIVSVGAGIDQLMSNPALVPDVPIIRTTGAELTQRMREYVCLHVLRAHRQLDVVMHAQTQSNWQQPITPAAPDRKVGVMGLGNLGSDSASALARIGFNVSGWARSDHQIQGVKTFAGSNQLESFLSGMEILVCMLPLTPDTDGILNQSLFAQLAPGASVINVGRGEHLVEADLLQALDKEQLSSATLDVFREEPLPADSWLWRHPKVLVTPHIASMIDPISGGQRIAQNLQQFRAGLAVADLVDPTRGY